MKNIILLGIIAATLLTGCEPKPNAFISSPEERAERDAKNRRSIDERYAAMREFERVHGTPEPSIETQIHWQRMENLHTQFDHLRP